MRHRPLPDQLLNAARRNPRTTEANRHQSTVCCYLIRSRRLRYRKPELPESVHSVHTHGGVLVYDVRIGVSGAVTDVKLAKPVDAEEPWPTLAHAWRSAIIDWRYEPTTVHGRPVPVCMTTTVTIDVM